MTVFQPCGNWCLASLSERDGEITTGSPGCQFAGVEIFCLAASWSESRTRNTSSKFRPVVPGYKKLNFSCNSTKYKEDQRFHALESVPTTTTSTLAELSSDHAKHKVMCNDIPSLQAPMLPAFFFQMPK